MSYYQDRSVSEDAVSAFNNAASYTYYDENVFFNEEFCDHDDAENAVFNEAIYDHENVASLSSNPYANIDPSSLNMYAYLSTGGNPDHLIHDPITLDSDSDLVVQSIETDPTTAIQLVTPSPSSPAAIQTLQTPPLTTSPPSHAPIAPNRAPIYAAFAHHFENRTEAATHRRNIQFGPLNQDGLHLINANEQYWLRRLHAAMISTSKFKDRVTSEAYRSFVRTPDRKSGRKYDDVDVEAQVWELLDTFYELYEVGLPLRKDRSALKDKFAAPDSALEHLELICNILEIWKSACVDVMEGGWLLQRLVAFPAFVGDKKASNFESNGKKAAQMKCLSKKRKAEEID
jgi:hypothetical protein